ncbi:MAG: hypothetical protein OIF54_11955, partial [Cohaesibacter sp.]|nr:hypothetical protein [Cohaesibacter sp.]
VSSGIKDHNTSDAVAEIDTGESVKAPVTSDEKAPTAGGRITFEIRAEKEKAPQTSSKKVRPLSEIALIHEADEMEEMQLGPAPAPFVPRNIPQNLSDKDWETALAHLAKPVEDLPVERLGMNANTRSPAQISKPPVRQRVGLAQIAPSVKAPSKPLSQDHKMIVTAGTSAEASISFTHVQSAPILLKARSDRSDADQQERLASVSMPTGPRSASKQKPVADLAEQSSAKPKITLTRQPLLSQTEQNKEQKPGLSDVTPLSQLVLRHTLFEPNHHDHCVLKKEDVPHGATIEAFADKPALAKPLLSDLSHLAVEADLPASASADTLDAFVHKASLGKPDISALLSDPDSIERPQLKRGIPAVFQTPYDSETETETETETEKSATILEQASSLSDLGFMPSLIDLEDLELVEAVPDMPSAGQALMDQHAQRATPAIELVEPVDLYFADSEDPQSDFDGEQSPMLVVAAQMEAERGKTTDKLEEQRAQSDVSILRDKMERDAPANPILQVQAEEQARQEASLHHEAAQIHIQVRSSPALDELVNEAGDLTDLPELSHHQIVGAEDLAALKSDASADALETAPMESASLSNERRPAARQTGSMDQFLAFDEETRLAILQSLISTTLPMNRADRFRRWPQGRPQLEEKHSSALLMARFASDTQTVAKVMHEISGHRKSDLIKLLQDPGGEALIAYLATIGLDESRALSMVLHAPDALSHSYDKVSKLMTLFDQMHPAAGLVIVEQLLGSLPQEERISQPKHVPVLDAGHDEKAARLRDNVDQEAQAHEHDPMITFGHRTGSDA